MPDEKEVRYKQCPVCTGYVKSVKVVKVIAITMVAGSGTDEDPNRLVKEYWDPSGRRIGTWDPTAEALPEAEL